MIKSILVVEDEIIIAEDIKEFLIENGFENVYRVSNKNDAYSLLSEIDFDLVLLDINLNNTNVGFEIADFINEKNNSSIIFLTSYSDSETVEKIMLSKPLAYILKPINKTHLLATIKIAFENKLKSSPLLAKENEESIMFEQKFISFKENTTHYRVPISDIYWIKSDKNYIEIHTTKRRYIVRCSLTKLQDKMPNAIFYRCHKSIIININLVQGYSKNEVIINAVRIPISRQNKKKLLLKLNQHQSI